MSHYATNIMGIFVNENGCVPYAKAIVQGCKPIETRTRNMLDECVGYRVAIVRTRRNKKPMVVGYATIFNSFRASEKWLDENRDQTLIPEGSEYDCKGAFKWCYEISDPEECEPFELPSSAIRHGRSWCEFSMDYYTGKETRMYIGRTW